MSLDIAITHRQGNFTLDVAFTAPPGVTVLFGRSGSGKTTLVNAVAGLLRPEGGRIAVGGDVWFDAASGIDRPPEKRGLGYIFQDGRLFPHLTVRQNLNYSRWFRGDTADAGQVIGMLGLGPLLGRRPAALSGGEKQRVAIGRALLAGPRLILADEPLAALDAERKAEILPYFERLRDAFDVPILYVSHSAAEVARLATTVIALENGRVMRAGPAAEVLADPRVTPLGVRAAGAVLATRVAAHHDDGLTELEAGGVPLFLPRVPQPVGATARVRIAAQEVLLARDRPVGLSALNVIEGRIIEIKEGTGPGVLVVLDTAAGRILARITARSATALGLTQGGQCFAVLKSLAIAPDDVGQGGL